jgi:hypothetical protein
VRRALPVLIGIVIVAAGLLGLLALFNNRDTADVSAGPAQGPGVLEQQPGDPPTSGTPGDARLQREGAVQDAVLLRALSIGNVALVYGTPEPPPELVRLRDDATGSFDPELAAAGQMAFFVRRPGIEGVQALAWMRRLETDDPADPQLRQFIDTWLGKGQGNTE